MSCNVSWHAQYEFLNKVPRNEAITSNNSEITKINNEVNKLAFVEVDKSQFDSISKINSFISKQNSIFTNKLNKVAESQLIKRDVIIPTKISAKHTYSQAQEMSSRSSLNWVFTLLLEALLLALILTLLGYLLPTIIFNWVLTLLLIFFVIYVIFYLVHWL
jgi:cation transport ATPase